MVVADASDGVVAYLCKDRIFQLITTAFYLHLALYVLLLICAKIEFFS